MKLGIFLKFVLFFVLLAVVLGAGWRHVSRDAQVDRSVAGDGEEVTTVSCGGSGGSGSATSAGELICNDDYSGLTSFFEYTVTEGETYVVVVDGYSSGSTGTYSLVIDEC